MSFSNPVEEIFDRNNKIYETTGEDSITNNKGYDAKSFDNQGKSMIEDTITEMILYCELCV